MKKILILLLLVASLFFVTGCNPPEEVPVLDYAKINNVLDQITLLPEEVTLEDEADVVEVRALYEELTADEKALITNITKLEGLETTIAAIKLEQQQAEAALETAFTDAQTYLMDYLPAQLTDDITLPQTYQSAIGSIGVLWSSSDRMTLSNGGVVTPGRHDIIVTMTTTLRYENITRSFNQKVLVKALTFDPLPTSRLSFGYLANRDGFSTLRAGEAEALDVVNYCFGRVSGGVASLTGLSDYQDVLALRKQGVRVVLCLGGYEDGAVPFSEASRTAAGRQTLATSIVQAVETYHYDGVDIDWEYPGYYTGENGGELNQAIDSANYTALMVELRRQLKQANSDYILSAAVPGGPWGHQRFEVENLAPVLDFFHLMTYDMDSATVSTHLNPLYSSSNGVAGCSVHDTVLTYVERGVPRRKLIVGIAFYARKFILQPTATTPMKQTAISRQSIFQYEVANTFLNRIESGEVIRYFDTVAKAAYLFDTVNKIAVSYEDRETIQYKAEYVINQNLGGVMFWEYGEDQTGVLLPAIYDYLVKNR